MVLIIVLGGVIVMVSHRAQSCFMLYMIIMSHVKKGWGNQGVWHDDRNPYTNHYCVAYPVISCRPTDFLVCLICCSTLDMLNHVQNHWVKHRFWYYVGNPRNNFFCSDVVYLLNPCRPVDFRACWV